MISYYYYYYYYERTCVKDLIGLIQDTYIVEASRHKIVLVLSLSGSCYA